MKLVASLTSPYARKARVMLAEKGLAFELVEENAWNAATTVPRYNPLNKVPVLVLDDGTCLYDSRVIVAYLDGLAAPPLLPPAGLERALAGRAEALADGIADAAVAIVLERRRDVAHQDPAWIARQMAKVEAGTAALATELGERDWLRGNAMTHADLAAGCALFYLEFRLPEFAWRSRFPKLAAYTERLGARPSFAATRPPA